MGVVKAVRIREEDVAVGSSALGVATPSIQWEQGKVDCERSVVATSQSGSRTEFVGPGEAASVRSGRKRQREA